MLFDFLVLLVILCILFGVEATRSFIFSAFGIIFWIGLIIAIIFILTPSPMQKFKREQRQKEEEARQKAEQERQKAISEARNKAAVAKQKKWRKEHPKKAKALDLMADHPVAFSVAIALVIVAITIGVVLLISK